MVQVQRMHEASSEEQEPDAVHGVAREAALSCFAARQLVGEQFSWLEPRQPGQAIRGRRRELLALGSRRNGDLGLVEQSRTDRPLIVRMEHRNEVGLGLHHRFHQTRLFLLVANQFCRTEERE